MLKELRAGVYIHENAIVKQFHLTSVPWPHFESELIELFLFTCDKELRHSPNLLVVLLI